MSFVLVTSVSQLPAAESASFPYYEGQPFADEYYVGSTSCYSKYDGKCVVQVPACPANVAKPHNVTVSFATAVGAASGTDLGGYTPYFSSCKRLKVKTLNLVTR